MGLINAGLTLLLTDECEMSKSESAYAPVPQAEEIDRPSNAAMLEESPEDHSESRRNQSNKGLQKGLLGRLSQISAPTRKIMYKLWLLLAVDSLADGMVSLSKVTELRLLHYNLLYPEPSPNVR